MTRVELLKVAKVAPLNTKAVLVVVPILCMDEPPTNIALTRHSIIVGGVEDVEVGTVLLPPGAANAASIRLAGTSNSTSRRRRRPWIASTRRRMSGGCRYVSHLNGRSNALERAGGSPQTPEAS